jgi:hypothetical protein
MLAAANHTLAEQQAYASVLSADIVICDYQISQICLSGVASHSPRHLANIIFVAGSLVMLQFANAGSK